MAKRLVIYTATFGDCDKVYPVKQNTGINYVVITNDNSLKVKGWKILYWDNPALSSSEKNRYVKMHPHEFFPDYVCSIYLDTNIEIVGDPLQFLSVYCANTLFALFGHRTRDCVYDEADECAAIGKITLIEKNNLIIRYENEGMPAHNGLTENCILYRQHNNKEVMNLMQQWWGEYINGVRRDQLSLPYLLWKHEFKCRIISFNIRNPNAYFRWRRHHWEIKQNFKYRIKELIKGFKWRKYRL